MRKREEEFGKVKKLYISMMSLFELADKLFGATYVAFMRSQKLSVVQISNLFSIQQILQAVFDYPTGTISDKIGIRSPTPIRTYDATEAATEKNRTQVSIFGNIWLLSSYTPCNII